ncbi:MAG: hypothetical protein OXT09_33100 [Myxococcales bacterium]|nr:hypothetical protein [Myxococcales bacterium]
MGMGSRGLLSCVIAWWLFGCNVQVWEPGKAPPAENQSGWEDPPAAESESAPEAEGGEAEAEEPEAPVEAAADDATEPTGPGTLVVRATIKGEPVAAAVQVLEGASVVARGESGESLTAPPGRYAIEVAIEDAATLADTPTKRMTVVLRAGETVNQPVSFPWAAIQLRVRINGKVSSSAKVDILRSGKVITTLQSDRPHVMFSPGRYDARVRVGGATIEVPQLLFPEGATRTVPVDVQM